MLQQDCPNGRLTPAKFVDMYKMFFPSGNAEEFCDHVFRTFDMDKNGYIDFKVSEIRFLTCDATRTASMMIVVMSRVMTVFPGALGRFHTQYVRAVRVPDALVDHSA